MIIVSLFDGISCGQEAARKIGLPIGTYYASEINKNSMKITQKNFPNTVQLGDVTEVTAEQFKGIPVDVLIGGSPCQDFSQYKAGYGLGLKGDKSKLFLDYLRLLKTLKPKYFLLENVPMSKDNQDFISKALGVEPIKIDSGLVSAADRRRLYWTNIPIEGVLEDKHLCLRDIVVDASEVEAKYWYDRPYIFHGEDRKVAATLGLNGHRHMKEVYSLNFKSNTLTTCNGGNLQKKVYQDGRCRKLIPLEYERLQNLPNNYTEGVADVHRYNGCGDGWTVDVIAYLLSGLKEK